MPGVTTARRIKVMNRRLGVIDRSPWVRGKHPSDVFYSADSFGWVQGRDEGY